jgi:hypothetical protein
MKVLLTTCAALLLAMMTTPTRADSPPARDCPREANQPLTFWLGQWDVYAGDHLEGHSAIESILGGCAIVEHWREPTGAEAFELFYFEPHSHLWKQVLVSDQAMKPGGLKERTLIYASPDTVRFQGTLWPAPDRQVLDRSTVRKLDGGRLGQIIEQSKDGGQTWIPVFDAVYRPPTK